jgi:hypothetical protein
MVLLCQPDASGCRPTRALVEICESAEDAGCRVRDGNYQLHQDLDVYDDAIRDMRGEDPFEDGD